MMYDKWRIGESHINALRAVLEIPAAFLISFVVTADELAQRLVRDALALDQPVAPPVERKPAVDSGDLRPLGHGLGGAGSPAAGTFARGQHGRDRARCLAACARA